MAAPSGLSHSPQRPYSLSAKVGSFLLATLPKHLMSTDRHKVRLDTDPLRNPDFASPYLGSPEEDRACAPSLSPSQLYPGDGERRRQWELTTHFEEMPPATPPHYALPHTFVPPASPGFALQLPGGTVQLYPEMQMP